MWYFKDYQNNSFFDEKRRIINNIKRETYIPVCTERVFNTPYSDSPEEMLFWSEKDREGYGQALLDMYACFKKVLERNSLEGENNAK